MCTCAFMPCNHYSVYASIWTKFLQSSEQALQKCDCCCVAMWKLAFSNPVTIYFAQSTDEVMHHNLIISYILMHTCKQQKQNIQHIDIASCTIKQTLR